MNKKKKNKFKKLDQQKIALLGFGLDNQALLKLLAQTKIPFQITICDFRPKNKLAPIKSGHLKISYQLEAKFNTNLDKFDLLFRSPGWPIACPGIQFALKQGQTELSSPLNLFFALCPSKNIIGVTGSKGKGTTASLIYKIIKDSKGNKNRKVFLGGNIGISPLSFVDKIKKDDFIVLELSSFQLEDLNYSPSWAIITNIFREHLAPADPNNPNFHSSSRSYWQAKLNIARHGENKYLIINKKLKTKISKEKLKTKIIYFQSSSLKSSLIGSYNQENIAAAVAVAKLLKIKAEQYKKTIASFSNLEHRLKLVATKNKVKYFDNSFSTTPESTILDLKSFSNPIILIAGGADKGADFSLLAKTIKQQVKFLILLPGQATPRIIKELKSIKFSPLKIKTVANMQTAVKLAKQQAKTGDIVLLSTACASFGIFKNYKERGEQFKYYVQKK